FRCHVRRSGVDTPCRAFRIGSQKIWYIWRMTAGSPQAVEAGAGWFTAPKQVNQRRYEALRAFYVDGLTHAEAGARFGYTRWGMVNLVREHPAGRLELFAPAGKPGPPPGLAAA